MLLEASCLSPFSVALILSVALMTFAGATSATTSSVTVVVVSVTAEELARTLRILPSTDSITGNTSLAVYVSQNSRLAEP